MSRLSVLASTYNHTENQIRVLIHSILGQSYTDLSLYILQDGPDENNTAKRICQSITDSRLFYEESGTRLAKWGFPNRNKKLFELHSKYVTFQSCDNYVTPKAYEWMIAVAEREGLDAVFTDIVHNYAGINSWNRDGTRDPVTSKDPPYQVLKSVWAINKIDISNFIIKTKIAQDVGGFKIDLPDSIQSAADGFFCETVLQKLGSSAKIAKLPMALFVHN